MTLLYSLSPHFLYFILRVLFFLLNNVVHKLLTLSIYTTLRISQKVPNFKCTQEPPGKHLKTSILDTPLLLRDFGSEGIRRVHQSALSISSITQGHRPYWRAWLESLGEGRPGRMGHL